MCYTESYRKNRVIGHTLIHSEMIKMMNLVLVKDDCPHNNMVREDVEGHGNSLHDGSPYTMIVHTPKCSDCGKYWATKPYYKLEKTEDHGEYIRTYDAERHIKFVEDHHPTFRKIPDGIQMFTCLTQHQSAESVSQLIDLGIAIESLQ